MKKAHSFFYKIQPPQIYLTLVILNYLISFCFVVHADFLSGTSVIYAFLFAAAPEISRSLTITALAWILLYILGIIISYVQIYKHKRYNLFYIIVVADLFVSLMCIILKICMKNYFALGRMLAGFIVQTFYSIVIILKTRRDKQTVLCVVDD